MAVSAKSRRRLPSTDRNERIYAIGDVHGRFDLLTQLLEKIGDHAEALPSRASTHLILLGDMVDRGPQSLEVLRYMQNVQQKSNNAIVLAGNHEELMVRALDGEAGLMQAWLRTGGVPTLKSLGFDPPDELDDLRAFGDEVGKSLPKGLLDWVRALPLTAQSGDYFFCHAGIRPGVPLNRQARGDLLWIRKDFLEDPRPHGAVIVHGHTVSEVAEIRDNRIGVDTGAYATDVLTAVYLEETEREIISVGIHNGVAIDEL